MTGSNSALSCNVRSQSKIGWHAEVPRRNARPLIIELHSIMPKLPLFDLRCRAAPTPTGYAALDAVNAVKACIDTVPPATLAGGLLPKQDGTAG